MKPTKKVAVSPRAAETRHRLSLFDRAEKAERKLFDAEAVVAAAHKFLEHAESDVRKAHAALEHARERLFAYNNARAKAIREQNYERLVPQAIKLEAKTLAAISVAKAGKVTDTALDDPREKTKDNKK